MTTRQSLLSAVSQAAGIPLPLRLFRAAATLDPLHRIGKALRPLFGRLRAFGGVMGLEPALVPIPVYSVARGPNKGSQVRFNGVR